MSIRAVLLPRLLVQNVLLETIGAEPVPKGTIRNIRSPSITLRVSLVGKLSKREINACALLDSGAEGMIIHQDFAKHHKLTLRTLRTPLPVRNVDGSTNASGAVLFTTIQSIRIYASNNQYHKERTEFYITAIGTHDIILGTDWLKAHNPEVNWTTSQLALTRCPNSCIMTQRPLIIAPTPRIQNDIIISAIDPDPVIPTFERAAARPFVFQHQVFKYAPLHVRAKATHATHLAIQNKPPPSLEHIPAQFRKYPTVFSEEASHRLPQHRPWDHAINLVPNATMTKCGLYCLTPAEEEALSNYLQEQLDKGYIRPSKSAFASPFFFVDKKDGKLCPVQDYRQLNDLTIKDATPLPLIPDLIDKLQGS